MRRVRALILVAALIIGCLSPATLMAAVNDSKTLPQIGEVVSGFKALEKGKMEIVNGQTVLFEHVKSGAKLLYIKNADKNRAFDISFKTPANDNTGVNHVLEHVSTAGSQKYPFKDVFFNISNQTYCSYINAFTTNTMTSYPVASMSEAQLLKLADVYMDCVFNPFIYKEPNLFKREAWRYEKENEGAPLNLTGIIYSEMQGSTDGIENAEVRNCLKALFPNGTMSNASGGTPEAIPTLTYEDVLKVHETYYHPSNALIVLYGDLDYRSFLKLLDENYLSQYDKKAITVDYKDEKPFTTVANKTYDFPAGENATTDESIISYAYAMTDISQTDRVGMSIIAEYLNQGSSIVQKAFKRANIGNTLEVYYEDSLPQPVLVFSVANTSPSKKEVLGRIVDESMKALVTKGFDETVLEMIIANTEFNNALVTEGSHLGVNIAVAAAQYWAAHGEYDYFSSYMSHIDYAKAHMTDGYLEQLVKKYIVGNKHAALVATVPKAGLLEQKRAQQKKQLAAKEASMTKEEVAKLISETASFNNWNAKEDSKEHIKELQAVSIKDLPIELKEYSIKDVTDNGVRYLSANADVGDTFLADLMFDTSGVAVEDLHYLQLYANLIGEISTTKHSIDELSTLKSMYLHNFRCTTDTWANAKTDFTYRPILDVSWLGLIGESSKSANLLEELLLETDFTQTDELLSYVKTAQSYYKDYFNGSPYNILYQYNTAAYLSDQNYSVYMKQTAYYHFLKEVESLLQKEPSKVTSKLQQIQDKIMNRTHLMSVFAGNESHTATFYKALNTFISRLPEKRINTQNYFNLPEVPTNLGIAMDTTVNYNMLSASFGNLSKDFSGKYLPLMNVISDKFLTAQLRYQNNVYSNIESVSWNGISLSTYMDPYIDKTLNTYKDIESFTQSYALTQESLDGYILKAFSEYTLPQGELSGAVNAVFNYMCGYSNNETVKLLEEIKSAQVSDLKELGQLINEVVEVGAWTSVGSKSNLEKNKKLYDQIISLQDKVAELNQSTNLTKKDFIDLLLGEDTYNKAVIQGLISGKSDEILTREEAAISIYKLLESQDLIELLKGSNVVIKDANTLSEKGLKAVEFLVGNNCMSLDEDNQFNGTSPLLEDDLLQIVLQIGHLLIVSDEVA